MIDELTKNSIFKGGFNKNMNLFVVTE